VKIWAVVFYAIGVIHDATRGVQTTLPLYLTVEGIMKKGEKLLEESLLSSFAQYRVVGFITVVSLYSFS
jgi:hypothetical protein